VNGVIGSAIFGMPGEQAGLMGALSPLGYLLAALGVLTVVLCFAEVASRFREAGGPYLYHSVAFGPWVGFEAGWLFFWSRLTALAANLNLFADYAAVLFPPLAVPTARLAVLVLLAALVAAVNVIGVRQASWTINAFTLAKLLPLALLLLLGLPQVRGEVLATQAVEAHQWTKAILLLVFAYGGFEAPLIPAGEARDPRRDTAPALLLALAVVASVYLLVQLVVVGVLPRAAGSPTTAVADTFTLLLGPAGALLAAVGALVSTGGYALGAALQAPRLLFAMAVNRDLPGVLGRVHERFRTPHVAVVVFALVALGLAGAGSFAANATLSAIVRLAVYALTCASVLVLRRRDPGEAPAFAVPGAGLVAPLGVLFSLWLLSTRSFEQAGALVGLMLLGALLRGAARARGRAGAV
jgi:amino acid transporter